MSDQLYFVVVNEQDQYSTWSATRELPPGWRAVGEACPKEECMRNIEALSPQQGQDAFRESLARGKEMRLKQ